VAALLVALLVLGGVLAAFALLRDEPSDDPVVAPTSENGTVTVEEEDYIGRPVAEVRRALREAGLRVRTREVTNPGGETTGDVISVDPTGRLDTGDRVTVDFWGEAPVEEPAEEPTTAAPGEEPTSQAPSQAPPTQQPSQEPSTQTPSLDPTSSGSPVEPSSPAASTAPATTASSPPASPASATRAPTTSAPASAGGSP
jgi:serine/threonine-protein kinase